MPPIAAVDVLGHLPGPVSKTNAGAGDLLAGEVFAYAVSSSIAVVDVSSSPSTEKFCWPLRLAGPVSADAPAMVKTSVLCRCIACSWPVSCMEDTDQRLSQL